jgi:outer membrane protein W
LEVFPPNAWGMDIMFGDAGFGLGTFFRKQLDVKWIAFADLSFSETKDEREFEYIDYFGNVFTVGKKNRVFQMPLNFGVHYRLFENDIADNLRPYLSAGVGPNLIITTPYELEFFNSFGKAQAKLGAGGYIGFGADFGLDKSSLIGINVRYYYTKLISGGVESLAGREKTEIQGFFITLNLGMMY